ncbi:hypothetical protein F383_38962 [Gossypium arboreum]|uniref:Uncharacterized protein n=1 Tax=Gossypium arboreum TaxID=29729 RepID=A0A0B0MC46_GOSAR|nr:hypothetical protein F383_38586 [Gossypium arboreum]KHG00557.1 hypothetical protein F383_38962 [Gossypium arboreum]
MPTSQTWSYT